MARELEEMPLFPLDTVLFPFASVRLFIFEDRYRELVRDCLAFDRPFGIVLIRDGQEVGGQAEPYMVGTVARIQKVHTFDDGRMEIQVLGERRFRIREFDESKSYLTGLVEPLVEHGIESDEEAEGVLNIARVEFESYIQRNFSRQDFAVQVVFPSDPVTLSFTIANFLHMENLEKQRLLETTDTMERMQDLLPILERQILEFEDQAMAVEPQSYYRLSNQDLRDWVWPN
ncbi:LON peptidase substrate-binding domain-containing protein [soil metagenome]